MPDYGRQATDAEYKRLRRRVVKIYQQAYKDIAKKAEDFMKKHEAKEKMLRQQLADGKITQADFDAWMRGQVFTGKQWEAKRQQMADTLYKADTIAQQMVNDSRFEVFAQNANYVGYSLEHGAGVDSGFNLYSSQSVARLAKEQPDLLPPKKAVGKDKSYKWYNGKINQCVTQGIIQGESLRQMADRIGKTTGESSASAMLRNARTMHTGAENAGRLEAMHQAQEKGVKLKKQWLATLDSHTRDTHADLDMQIVDVDQPFTVDGMEIMYPGDPNAEPELVWNCRCTMVEVDPEFPDGLPRRDGDGNIIEDMSYREWEKWKAGNG